MSSSRCTDRKASASGWPRPCCSARRRSARTIRAIPTSSTTRRGTSSLTGSCPSGPANIPITRTRSGPSPISPWQRRTWHRSWTIRLPPRPGLAPARPSSGPITALPRWASRCATASPLSASSMGKREPETVAKTALITGISGQDGAYLARALLGRGYRVVGAFRRTSGISVGRLEELGISGEVELVDKELLEASNLRHVLNKLKPDEIYNLAAQSFVGLSFERPLYTSDIDALGVLRLLEAMREVCPGARFYQASTSEMFGTVQETPQNEKTPFYPRSPYGVA